MMRWLAGLLLGGWSLLAQGPFDAARVFIRETPNESLLAGSTVHALHLDIHQRLWAATQEGILVREGREWRPKPLPPGLPTQHVRHVTTTQDGALWVGTEGAGLLRWHQGQWTRWSPEQGFPVARVNHILEVTTAGGSEVWAATAKGVGRWDGRAWTWTGAAEGLASPFAWRLALIRQPQGPQELWVATQAGVQRWQQGRWQAIPGGETFPGTSANDLIQVPRKDGKQEVWASCWDRGLARWDGQRWHAVGPAQGFPSLNPTCLSVTQDLNGAFSLWAGTYDAGLFQWNRQAWRAFTPHRTLPATGIYSLLPVPGQRPTLWIGTRGAGLLTLNAGGWRLLDDRDGLPSSEVNCFAVQPTPQGEALWFGTSLGLLRWEGDRKQAFTPKQGFPSTRVNALLATASTVYAGTINGLVQSEGSRFRLLGPKDGLPVSQVTSFLETPGPDGQTELWVGMEAGLARRTGATWRLVTTHDGLPHNWINALAYTPGSDGKGCVWAATRGGGVASLHHNRWVMRNEGLSHLGINTFQITRDPDRRHWLWAGSAGGGLLRLEADRPGSRWTQVAGTEAFPLGDRFIYRLEQDRQGRLYASTPRGILRITLEPTPEGPRPVRVEDYTLADGLPSMGGIWFPSSVRDGQGRVWFGMPKGAVALDPDQEGQASPIQTPRLKGFMREGRVMDTSTALNLREGTWRGLFEFHASATHRAEDIRYQTQLWPAESEPGLWFPEGRREVSGLAPGTYELRVWARDHQGQRTAPLVVPFQITPAPWKSPWAYALYALTAGAAIAGFFRLRVLMLRRHNEQLSVQVAQRTIELAKVNQNLEALNQSHQQTINDLLEALTEVKTLRGLIPICMKCKKIRDDQGLWNQIEAYLATHSEARFSHGYCPDCADVARKEVEDYKSRIKPIW